MSKGMVETAVQATAELLEALKNVNEESCAKFTQEILNAKKIFLVGAGRSMLMLRGFAMRLMHVGFEVYMVGDTTTPAFEAGDLLIVGSGSGETKSSVNTARKAKSLDGRVALITTRAESTLAEISDCEIVIPAYTDKVRVEMKQPTLPGGTMFEEALLILCDTLILSLAAAMKVPTDKPFSRHANLE
jgi:6-phospho-3-hexuloisomerase